MDTNRLEAFSDGVFAIAITLLVLAIKVSPPSTALGAELLHQNIGAASVELTPADT